MYPSPDDFDQPFPPPDRARERDRGLRRGRRLTRWIGVAAVTGAAALGSLYAHLLPGDSASPAPSSPPVHNPAGSAAVAPTSSGDEEPGGGARHENDDSDDGGEDDGAGAGRASQPAPQPPAQPPAPTQQPPHTTTGAS
jgi:hypothetical protein